ncbi:sensor histidine kinase [Clostridium omnivorum]|uniref:histidine kinase n=1 Tax=Clostridium omnivorum TaxID=1604902 RepID=A0ABQ5NAH1_9CLOT|nr:ATP-binding protein [Clostridium sp. E14]GLC32091.1 sensor histidine kinase [Clostridium sp. E14]
MKIKVPRLIRWIFKPIELLLRPLWFMLKPLRKLYNTMMEKVEKSIRAELVYTFVVCLLAAMFIFSISNSYYRRNNKIATIDYQTDMHRIANVAVDIVNSINREKYSINQKEEIEKLIQNKQRNSNEIKIIIVDLDGKAIYKSQNASESQVDMYNLIKNAMEVKQDQPQPYEANENSYETKRKEYVSFYPVNFSDTRAYVIVKGIPQGQIEYNQTGGTSFVAVLIAIASFVFIFLYLTKNKMAYVENIANGLMEISKGNLDYRVERSGEDELASLADNINFMVNELQVQIEAERSAERTKNELITNVSHDLRTPLTSVMGYLGLVKDGKYENEQQMIEYLNIAYNKADKLKVLIEDLFEYTKLTNSGIKLNKEIVDINEFVEQLIEEMVPMAEQNNITMMKEIPNEKVMVNVDVDKCLRVFENLISNAIKYSEKPGDIWVRIIKKENSVLVCVENKGENISKEDLSKIFDRFYRLEKSRSSSTGGSGLGLAIAKNIVELHEGNIWAESKNEIISFYVELNLER